MNIRLEYSPIVGQFNKAQARDKPDLARGFKTLCCFLNASRADHFIMAVQHKYPPFADANREVFPSLALMKAELFDFLDEDARLLGEHLTTTFQRRSNVFRRQS